MDALFAPLVGAHAVAATSALVLGAVNVVRRRRGDPAHRLIGRVWLVAMYFTAGSSFWIQDLRPGSYSWIHGLSAFTIVTLSLGLWNARRGRVRAHAGNMIGTYVGLLGALVGVVVVPDRLVPTAFQQDWLGMTTITAIIVGVGLAFTWLVIRLLPDPAHLAATHAGTPDAPDGGTRQGPSEGGPLEQRPQALPTRPGEDDTGDPTGGADPKGGRGDRA